MEQQGKKDGYSVSGIQARSFLSAFILLFILMITAYALCFILPAGEYQREVVDGQTYVVSGSYTPTEGGLSFWRWLLSPFLVLGYDGGGLMIAIIAFLLVIAGTFTGLENCGVLRYMLQKLAYRYRSRRRQLLFLVPLLFMSMGAFIGSFEEAIPLTPIAISLALAMGWDVLTGLGISLLAVGCGFSSGVLNPFTVGVAQTLAGLPMFSGISMRLLSFGLIYALLMFFLCSHVRKLESSGAATLENQPLPGGEEYSQDAKLDRALRLFVIILCAGIACILAFSIIPGLSDLVLPATALMFFVAGIVCVPVSGATMGQYGKWFLKGMVGLAPAAMLLLMAGSIRFTLSEGGVMDTILHGAVGFISGQSQAVAILLVYALVLVLNSVIASGSAKAFLLIPLITPVIDMVGISRQLSVLAFIYGDGFSNVFYPTNPALLISLSIGGISYGKWARFTWKFQLGILAITAGLLLFGLWIGY